MHFTNDNLWVMFEWNGEPVYATQTLISTWVVMAVLIFLAVIIRIRLRSFKDIPGTFQNIIESPVEIMSNFTKTTMGTSLKGFDGCFFSIFLFILTSNYCGLISLRPPTADLATTAALALITFILIHITGIRMRKGKYFAEYFSPNPLFFPINLVGEIAKPISLGFRLFGNILGAVIIIDIVYFMLPIGFKFILPNVLHAYFDIFAGALQTFIFTVLSMTFIRQKALGE